MLFTLPRIAQGRRFHQGRVCSTDWLHVFRHRCSHELDGRSGCCNIFHGPNSGVVWFCGWDGNTLMLHELQIMDVFTVLTSNLPCWSVTVSHAGFQELPYTVVRTATLERHTVFLSKSWNNFFHHRTSLSSYHTWNVLIWTLLGNLFVLHCYCPWLSCRPSVKGATMVGLRTLCYFAFSIC